MINKKKGWDNHMSETFFAAVTDADKRSAAAVKESSVDKLSAGIPWYDKAAS